MGGTGSIWRRRRAASPCRLVRRKPIVRTARGRFAARVVAVARLAAQRRLGLNDRPRPPRRVGPDRQRREAVKMFVAFDGEAEGQAHRLDLAERETTEFGTAEAKVGKAEQGIAIRVDLGREPCRGTEGIEEFD